MKKINKYILIKKNIYHKYKLLTVKNAYELNTKKLSSSVNRINIYNEKFINNTVYKKIDSKIKKILELMIAASESDDEPGNLFMCLNETDKFKHELINKYRNYLSKQQKEFIEKKVMLMEKEIQKKLLMYQIISRRNNYVDYQVEEEEEKSRSR